MKKDSMRAAEKAIVKIAEREGVSVEYIRKQIQIAIAALILLYIFVFFKKWKRKGKNILLVNTLMYIYLSFMLYFTLMPIITSIQFILNHPYVPMNLIPFVDVLAKGGDYLSQIVLNITMTVPFGFLFPLTQNKITTFGKTVFFCFLMSLCIELLQPLINELKSSDVTNLLTNLVGGMLGYVFYVIFKPVPSWILEHIEHLRLNSPLLER